MTTANSRPKIDASNPGTASTARKPCGANTPVTWGELFLMLEERPNELRDAVLEKIMLIDAEMVA